MRKPNPWITLPALGTGLLAGALAWVVTDVSCRTDTGIGCPGWGAFFAVLSFLGATIGVGLLLVLVYRSLAEWRQSLSPRKRDDHRQRGGGGATP